MPGTHTYEEREFSDWILRIESRAVLPLKWILLGVCAIAWLWMSRWTFPPLHVFMLFFLYMMATIVMTVFIRFRRVPSRQAKGFVVVSYCIDLAFVTLLFLFDILERRMPGIRQSEFYLLYFLLVLRGAVFFRSARGHLIMSILISALFIGSLWLQEQGFAFIGERTFIVRFALIWLVILLTWFIVEIMNQQQREVMRARERLLRSENLARLGEVAAGVAHEINNPIGIISAYSEFLMRQAPEDDARRADYETIQREALRCKTILTQMFALASPGSIQFVPVDLGPLLDEVYGEALAERENLPPCRLERDYPPTIPPVRGQPDQLRQAFLNVLLNARQAMPGKDGIIRVSIRHLTNRASEPVQVLIADTGSGIDPGDVEKAFEPFFTRKERGTGLGLAITRRIIEAHEGAISIRPAEKRTGTVVEILLPSETSN